MLLEISNSLRRYLGSSFPEITGDGWIEIVSSIGAAGLPSEKLVLFLYAVEEAAALRDEFQAVVDREVIQPPLALNLRYLVIFNSTDHEEAQRRLARVLEAFHSRPVLGPEYLDPGFGGRIEQLTVRLLSPTNEDLNHLWTALNLGMRLALYYEVSATLKRSDEEEAPRR